jgi:hypothetical protein
MSFRAKLNIAAGAIAKLRKLENYKVVLICDDSTSMTLKASEPPAHDPLRRVPTRWEELCSRTAVVADLATCLDQSGIDIYFLNSNSTHNIHDEQGARGVFRRKPKGTTPLTKVYRRVLAEKLPRGRGVVEKAEKKVFIIIATDGEPDDQNAFAQLLRTRDGIDPQRCPTTIMACTNDLESMEWLNALDTSIPFFDVVQDYANEQKEVAKHQGRLFPFSEGDYVTKVLLGALDPVYDCMDERALSARELAEYYGNPPAEFKTQPAAWVKENVCTLM